ncbi:cobaltochelatase subunit CobN [Chelativorans salis]|uniref:Cobaltochelatase subunit CobN n=1 Tax=Chelativorans salis TaxID=2978478 RepID=A0ABT2LT05_9HYPH|nr:cobaltochelatase subunit CobN [Chelativorans sp. EGI FJ00035]MCT7377666.1 cobaltochelatase subunit CobN [Chelativorans sp. EGI FJ00035]
MHILATSSASLEDLIDPVDLRQTPAEMVALSFTDSDLAAIAAAWGAGRETLPSLRLAALSDLRHPMSVDLWIDSVASHAKVVVARILGGYDWWRYGCDRLAAVARERGISLVLLPGECRADDERLAALSTVGTETCETLLGCFREGGPENMTLFVRHMARLAGHAIAAGEARPLARAGYYAPGEGIVDLAYYRSVARSGRPVVPVLFYRSMLLANDVAPIDALFRALDERGILAVPVFVSTLRDASARQLLDEVVKTLRSAALITTTAFAIGMEGEDESLFDSLGLPVFQVAVATTRRDAWESGQRGMAPADLAMHVVLPELDGRIMAGAISFKDRQTPDPALAVSLQVNRPEPDRVAQVAERLAAFLKLQSTPPAERQIAIILPDYPAATGRSGYAVGLDVPQSAIAMLHDLKAEGYRAVDIPETPRALMRLLERERAGIAAEDYAAAFAQLPQEARNAVEAAWGAPGGEDFCFRTARFGNVTVAFAPDRGRSADRRMDYHDPVLPPGHPLIAFGVWLREGLGCHALVHLGAHGTLEWLPGKAVALSAACFPELMAGPLPVIYPFIVSNPGEAAQAKRRIAAVTLGHLTPPLVGAGLSEEQQALERLVDEYAQADGLDRRRRDRLAKLIVETAQKTGLAREAGVDERDDPEAALLRIDAWLCDLKDFAIKDGLHIYGRAADGEADPLRMASAERERAAFMAALDGKRVRPGPSGAPSRGRTDVLPTGRNLFTADPRTLPTPTAVALGTTAADEIVRAYLQDHGDYPCALVLDLWGSASLRTGGEEIAQGLALMGCRPQWDAATGRVTGIEVLPPAVIGRPRIDVTWRISGLFRDMFPTQIALIDAAIAAVAARDETQDENPLAAASRSEGRVPARIFGSAPGTYGAGIEERLARGDWQDRSELGKAYLDAASHVFGGAEGEGQAAPGTFAERVGGADLLVHTGDDPGRDILEGSADVAFIGGFSAALAALGGKADLVVLDTTDPERPRARSLAAAVTRAVRARALNPRFIDGQLRHGPRGAAEFAETVDRLVGFAETTNAIPGALIEAVHAAYLEDERVRDFLLRENPAALRAIAERFADARRRGLWHPRRNAVDNGLAGLIAEARRQEEAA